MRPNAFESGEDFLTGDRLDATRIDVVDAALDLFFPFLTEIAEVFAKTTQSTPATVIKNSQRRLRAYDEVAKG